ncbi:WD40 repeat domain-containing protein [Lacibacter luteus]|uniref:WD40 repeat domain-containing protein n=1 Tax=Lacibacter luteus TaxID=2508719 RepID=A0A4Q1CFT5_9BACT|nr:WD40 repeat domain-containing protein [Lacibacter luteus]RXK58563.1 WD40 repeat domain-containing protein [Lacibacter luteus]
MAQELSWIDLNYFAVGRWDGSLSIFQFTQSQQQGPLITEAVNTPSAEGVQMITWLSKGIFATSNDEQSVITWFTQSGDWSDLTKLQTLSFDPSLGVANSGTSYTTPDNTALYFIIGHANGFISIWKDAPTCTNLQFLVSVDLRAANPVNPWGIHNIRGVSTIFWDNTYGYIVTGSEDGNLCVVRIPDGQILSTTVYNPQAQRGINSIATLGQNLLVANCAVGQTDKNLWYYWIDSSDWSITLRDARMLQVDPSLPQVFNFDIIWGYYSEGLCWFSTTEEGVLWMGTIQNNQTLDVIGNQTVTAKLGAALAMCLSGDLALAAYDLYEFNTTPGNIKSVNGHPERFEIV